MNRLWISFFALFGTTAVCAGSVSYYAPYDESCKARKCAPGDVVYVYSIPGDPAVACYQQKDDCFTPRNNQKVRIYEVRGDDVESMLLYKVVPLDQSRPYWIDPLFVDVKPIKTPK